MNPSGERIVVRGLQLFGHHGASAEERERGGLFSLDLQLEGKFGSEDDLEATVDYCQVIRKAEKINARSQFKLIETFARAVAKGLLNDFPQVQRAQVKVKKIRPPLAPGTVVEWVAAEVIGEREGG